MSEESAGRRANSLVLGNDSRPILKDRADGDGPRLLRPCIVLGSAPGPHIPATEGWDVICVNSSGGVARDLDLPVPLVTVLAGFKLVHPNRDEDRQALRGLRTQTLLLLRYLLPWPLERVASLLESLDYRYESMVTMGFADKARIIKKTTGRAFGDANTPATRVSNGVFAVCYAIHQDAPEVMISGVSLTKNGHYYSACNRHRHHVRPDTEALLSLRQCGCAVKTSEPDVARLTGIPLVERASGLGAT